MYKHVKTFVNKYPSIAVSSKILSRTLPSRILSKTLPKGKNQGASVTVVDLEINNVPKQYIKIQLGK